MTTSSSSSSPRITNLNYKGFVVDSVSHLPFSSSAPYMYVQHVCYGGDDADNKVMKLVIFKSGKCRLMGGRQPIDIDSSDADMCVNDPPLRVRITHLMSASVTFSLPSGSLNLKKLGDYCFRVAIGYTYEPEIFQHCDSQDSTLYA